MGENSLNTHVQAVTTDSTAISGWVGGQKLVVDWIVGYTLGGTTSQAITVNILDDTTALAKFAPTYSGATSSATVHNFVVFPEGGAKVVNSTGLCAQTVYNVQLAANTGSPGTNAVYMGYHFV